MQNIIITPRKLEGIIKIPPSKSLAHRGIIAASLSKGTSTVSNVQYSKDIIATLEIMKELGSTIKEETTQLQIDGRSMFDYNHQDISLQCNESGSTLRFLIPIALVKEGSYIFQGKGKLIQRPLNPYYEIFDEKKIKYSTTEGGLPLKISGNLKSGVYSLRGDISSQFITGLLFALPLLWGDSKIVVTTELESKAYIDLTLDVLKDFGVHIENENYQVFNIKGNQNYNSRDFYIEGDYSQGAFFLVADAIGSSITCGGLKKESLQGDKVIIDILKKMGCKLEYVDGSIKALPSETKGIDIDVSQCPDLVPILAVIGSLSRGTTRILNARRLRIKECDRLMVTAQELNKLGAKITELEDSLIIEGIESFNGGRVNSHNDHRIAMALSIAATMAKDKVIIENPMAIEKSYPNFYEDYISLGGEVHGFHNRK